MKVEVPDQVLYYQEMVKGRYGRQPNHIVEQEFREAKRALKIVIGYSRYTPRCDKCGNFHNLRTAKKLCVCVNKILPFKTDEDFGCRMCNGFQLP